MDSEKLWPRTMGYIHGCPMNISCHSTALVDAIMDMEFYEDDIIIATYPKTGTTMTQEIAWLVMNNGDTAAAGNEYISARIPFLDYTPVTRSMVYGKKHTPLELFVKQNSPRICKVHLPWNLGPGRAVDKFGAKLICVLRNPKDTAVSYYYFAQAFSKCPYVGPFADFLKVFLGPDMSYGSIFDHYLGYWKERHRDNVLILYYEDLVHDHRAQIVKLAKFLQKHLSDEVIDRIVEATKFKTMKENPMTNYATDDYSSVKSAPPFMRKGETGDWKNHFTTEEAEIFDRLIAEKLRPVGIRY